jgi:hypothetical protein
MDRFTTQPATFPSSDRQLATPHKLFSEGATDAAKAPDWCDLFTSVLDKDFYSHNPAAMSQVNRRTYAYSKALLLRTPEQATPIGWRPQSKFVQLLNHQNTAARQQTLRCIVARLAPPAARDAVWLGNALTRPIEALRLQATFIGSLMPRAQLSYLHAAVRHYAFGDGSENKPLAYASHLTCSQQRPDGLWTIWKGTEAQFTSTVASILSAVLVGDGTAFTWEDKLDALEQLQRWLWVPRHGVGAASGAAWSAEDTHRLHNLLCMLGHDPLQAWVDHEMRLAGPANLDYRGDLMIVRRLQIEQIFLPQATRQRMYPYQTDVISAAVCQPRSLSPLCSSLRILTSINLSSLQLQDIPQSLSTLTNLREADLENNQLQEFPGVLKHWPRLKMLSLSSNLLNQNAAVLAPLPALESLRLCHNGLTALPQGLSQLTGLRDLYVSANPLATLPNFLATLPSLRFIAAYNTDIAEYPAQFVARPEVRLGLS